MAVLKPSTNLFALLDSNDPGDTANNDAVQASAPVNINRKQQPEPSIWKLKAIEAKTAKNNKKKKQPAVSKAKHNIAPAAAKKPPPQQQQPAASKAYNYYKVSTTSNAATNKQQPDAPVNLTGELFGRAYPSARYLIYQNRKPRNVPENAKDDGVVGGAPADGKKGGQDGARQKGGHANGVAVKSAPAPVQEEPPAPVKPMVPPPPPPNVEDLKQFPQLK